MNHEEVIWAPVASVQLNPSNARHFPFDKNQLHTLLERHEWDPAWLALGEDNHRADDEPTMLRVFLGAIRREFDSDEAFDVFTGLISLAQSIGKPERLINPITADKIDGGWLASTGNRRLLAHVIMGADKIRLREWSLDDRGDMSFVELQENLSRADLSAYEELSGVQKALELKGLSIADVSINKLQRLVGWTSRARSQRVKAILSDPRPKILELVKQGALPTVQQAFDALKLSDKALATLGGPEPHSPKEDENHESGYKTKDAAARILKIGGADKHQKANRTNIKSIVIGHQAQGLLAAEEAEALINTIDVADKETLATILVKLNRVSIDHHEQRK